MPSAEPSSPGEAGAASQDPPRRAARRTPWLLLGLLAVAVIVAVVAMLGWDTAITRADQQTSKAAAAQATALQQQVTALQRELTSSKEREQALQGQPATAASELAQAQAEAAGLDAAEARAAAAEKAAAAAERGRVEAQARVDALEFAARTADRRSPGGVIPAVPVSSPRAAPLAAEIAAGASPALPLPGLPADATAQDYLVAARQAIRAGNAGEAQASLERAETRLLNRASLAAGPNRPLHHPGIVEIEQVLDQLGANDSAGALATIDRLLAQH